MRIALVSVVLCAGCVSQAALRANDPPARLTLGAARRHFAAPVTADTTGVFRTTTPPPKTLTQSHEATMGTIGFTMGTPYGTYAGGEIETGVLDTPGSSTASVYGVAGARYALSFMNIAAELAAGHRWVRYGLETENLGNLVVEPRLRADLWLSSQFSFGGTAGLTLGDQTVWMAGLFLGIHSHDFGGGRRR